MYHLHRHMLNYGYDFYDQLTNAVRSGGPNGAFDAAYNYGYHYDQVGNRLHEDRGAQDLDGVHNPLNQLTHLAWSGKLNIVGSVGSTNAYVLVQGLTNAPPFYNFTNWLGAATLGTGSNAVSIVAWQGTNATEKVLTLFAPPTNPQRFMWDLNGNLTNDGQRAYTWDEENRLVAIETDPAYPAPTRKRSVFSYDGMGRRVQRQDLSGWSGGAYQTTNVVRFVYDGWNVLAELSAANAVSNYYVWGLDLSQTLQGAGGIGGLLARCAPSSVQLYFFDGNGNVADLMDAQGNLVGHYDYDPFGRTVAKSGAKADENLYRFSTKMYEPWWDLYCFGLRFHSPSLGRWLSRDPVAEYGGVNVYRADDGVSSYDPLGLAAAGGGGNAPPYTIDLETVREHSQRIMQRRASDPALAEWMRGRNYREAKILTPYPLTHPADEGKPCCKLPQRDLAVGMRETSGFLADVTRVPTFFGVPTVGQFSLQVEALVSGTGHAQDVQWWWTSCLRAGDTQAGLIPGCITTRYCALQVWPLGITKRVLNMHVGWLSCEGGKWQYRQKTVKKFIVGHTLADSGQPYQSGGQRHAEPAEYETYEEWMALSVPPGLAPAYWYRSGPGAGTVTTP